MGSYLVDSVGKITFRLSGDVSFCPGVLNMAVRNDKTSAGWSLMLNRFPARDASS